jgi:hypothetical protein
MEMTGGSHLSVRERERRGVPVRGRASWATGRFPIWADSVPLGLLLFFFSFLFFSFSVFIFLS